MDEKTFKEILLGILVGDAPFEFITNEDIEKMKIKVDDIMHQIDQYRPVFINYENWKIQFSELIKKIEYEKGIIITEELLLKIGKEINSDEIEIQGFLFEFRDKETLYYTAGEGVSVSKPILYLHELRDYFLYALGEKLNYDIQ